MLYYVRKPTLEEISEYKKRGRQLFAVYIETPDKRDELDAPIRTLFETSFKTFPIYFDSLMENGYMPDMEGARDFAYDHLATSVEIILASDIKIM